MTNGQYELISSLNGGPPSVTNGTIVTSGSSVTITQTCPQTDAGVSTYVTYDSDGMKVVTLYTSTPPVNALTFTRQ